MALFNQYSYLVLGLALWLGLAAWLLRDGPTLGDAALLAAAAAVLVGGWLALRTGPSPYSDAATVDALLGRGRPVLVEVYSDF